MTARTELVRRAVARAGTRGLAHLAHQADTGTWISTCGRQVRGQAITATSGPAALEVAAAPGFCPACRDLALAVADDLAAGVALLLRLPGAHPAPVPAPATLELVPAPARHPAPAGRVTLPTATAALEGALPARVRVTATADDARVVLTVPLEQLAALLERLGALPLEGVA